MTTIATEKYDSREDTEKHIRRINQLTDDFTARLRQQASRHDLSKLEDPEKKMFDEITSKLKENSYGSDGYKAILKEMQGGLAVHYKNNSHHPEHYINGIAGMDLFDIVEMLADWKAATERSKDGDIGKSLKIQKERFVISDQLYSILENTAKKLGWMRPI